MMQPFQISCNKLSLESKTSLEIIAISGKIGSGKDYLANIIKEKYNKSNVHYIHIAFADFLKLILLAENNESKNISYNNLFVNKDKTSRVLLQKIGEEKRKLNNNFWITLLLNNILMHKDRGIKKFIISDLRFVNEFDNLELFCKNNSIILTTIRIIAPNRSKDKIVKECITETASFHDNLKIYKDISEDISETSLDMYEKEQKFTHIYYNDKN